MNFLEHQKAGVALPEGKLTPLLRQSRPWPQVPAGQTLQFQAPMPRRFEDGTVSLSCAESKVLHAYDQELFNGFLASFIRKAESPFIPFSVDCH